MPISWHYNFYFYNFKVISYSLLIFRRCFGFWKVLEGVGMFKEMKNEIKRIGNGFEVIENHNLLHTNAILLIKKTQLSF